MERIEYFRIFDRWGEQVYGHDDFEPNSFTVGWDGTFRERPMFGVFVWTVKVRYIDGTTETIFGDVTVAR